MLLPSQVKLLQDLHTELPLLTKAMINCCEILKQPWLWIVAIIGFVLFLRQARVRGKIASLAKSFALLWKPFRRMWTAYQMSEWCEILALQVDSGVVLGAYPESAVGGRRQRL